MSMKTVAKSYIYFHGLFEATFYRFTLKIIPRNIKYLVTIFIIINSSSPSRIANPLASYPFLPQW